MHVVPLPTFFFESHKSPCAAQISGGPIQQICLLRWAEVWEVDGFFSSLPRSLWLPVEQCVVAVAPDPASSVVALFE